MKNGSRLENAELNDILTKVEKACNLSWTCKKKLRDACRDGLIGMEEQRAMEKKLVRAIGDLGDVRHTLRHIE